MSEALGLAMLIAPVIGLFVWGLIKEPEVVVAMVSIFATGALIFVYVITALWLVSQ